MMENKLDGNAAGDILQEIFPFEMTQVQATCTSCGATNAIGALAVYMHGMGTVICCPSCDTVLIRVAQRRGTPGWICGACACFRSTQRSRTGKQHDDRGKGKIRPPGKNAATTGNHFDLDGVLPDTSEDHDRAWKHLADDEQIPCTREENDAHLRGVGRRESLEYRIRGRFSPGMPSTSESDHGAFFMSEARVPVAERQPESLAH
ncbi:MAG: hypothetical protein J2P37_00455 [Ktedonobacteraceae bacterium]|nr:hypothetical protein [Ktedonobacteraceae bacterium]